MWRLASPKARLTLRELGRFACSGRVWGGGQGAQDPGGRACLQGSSTSGLKDPCRLLRARLGQWAASRVSGVRAMAGPRKGDMWHVEQAWWMHGLEPHMAGATQYTFPSFPAGICVKSTMVV